MSKRQFNATAAQRLAADPQNSVWVTANAGSGKTHVLVERVARLLLAGAEPSTILCITYTKAAAAEMSSRLFSRLSTWTTMRDASLVEELTELNVSAPSQQKLRDARRLFARALETPGGLKIQTIHAFCEKLLQQFPIEAGMAPGFRVMDERDAEQQISAAIDEVLTIANITKNSELEAALSKVVPHLSSDSFENLLKVFLSNAKGLRNILNIDLEKADFSLILKNSLKLSLDSTSESLAAEINSIDHESYLHHADLLFGIKPYYGLDTAKFLKSVAASPTPLEIFKTHFLTGDLEPRKSLISTGTETAHPASAEFLKNEQQRIVDLLYQHDLLLRIEATSNLFILAKAVHHKIEHRKKQLGLYDFDDLISRTTNLLTASRAAEWVLYKLDAGLTHILVDEAQDTSPAQWKIIEALVEEFFAGQGGSQKQDRTLFVVGDRKQSIYSFQGADIHGLARANSTLSNRITGSGKTLSKVDLDISYRSTKEVLAIVDRVFPPTQPGRLGFELADTAENPHQSNRMEVQGKFQLWPVLEGEDEDAESVPWDAPVDREPNKSARRLMARKIATTIKSWIGSRELKPRGRMIEAGDILVLFQSRNPLFSMLISELRKLGVPVAGSDRLKLHESLIVQDLLILLQWLLLPQDDYALACTLKGPLLAHAISEDALMQFAIGRGMVSLWDALQKTPDANSAKLFELKKNIDTMGPYDFFANVLTTARRQIVERLGTEAIDASNAFLDQAMAYQTEHGYSLAGFLHWFQASETSIKREMEQASGEVRLMTVHGAKGLEANIVFLADAAAVPNGGRSDPSLLLDPDGGGVPLWALGKLTVAPNLQSWKDHAKLMAMAERNRLLYVAMTRACDELHVCGIKTSKNIPPESWYATIETAIGKLPVNLDDGQELNSTPQGVKKSFSQQSKLPAWAMAVPAKENGKSIYSLTGLIAKHKATSQGANSKAQRRGTAIHVLLHELSNMDEVRQVQYAKNWAKRLNYEQNDALNLLELIKSPELSMFFGPDSHGEAELRGTLPDGREVSGRVDRLNIESDHISVLDYKSDRFIPESIDKSHPYVHQMALYSALLEQAYPNRKIKAALLWTQSAKLMWIEPDLLILPRTEALAELALEAP